MILAGTPDAPQPGGSTNAVRVPDNVPFGFGVTM
jgi:hypothetical protein